MKKNIFTLFAMAIVIGLGISANAQVARYYNLFSLAEGSANDLTACLPGATTNQIVLASGATTNQAGKPGGIAITSSNITLRCYEYDTCGFTFQTTGIAGSTNGGYGVLIYGSASKGAVWDTNPRWNFTTTNVAPGSQTYTIVTNLVLTGLDQIGFSFVNAEGTNGFQTNVICGISFKATKVRSRASED